MQRYFANISNDIVTFTNEDTHHIIHVMRFKVGQHIEVVDNQKTYLCEITSLLPLTAKVVNELVENNELTTDVTLFFVLAKGDKLDLVVQKATELGVKKIVLLKSKRSIVKYEAKDVEKKLCRFSKIAKEASEQSKRSVVPQILGVYDINHIPSELHCEKNLVAYEKESSHVHNLISFNNHKSISIVIGSEGGLEEEEVLSLNKQGFSNVSLGKRILRCETAAIYALSVISYLIEK